MIKTYKHLENPLCFSKLEPQENLQKKNNKKTVKLNNSEKNKYKNKGNVHLAKKTSINTIINNIISLFLLIIPSNTLSVHLQIIISII